MILPRLLTPIFFLSCFGSVAFAQCTAADLKGDFATQPRGTLTAGPFAGPFSASGVIHFDGVGKFKGTATSSFNGNVIYPFVADGNYTVTPDCLVTVVEIGLRISFEGFLSASKNEITLVQPDSGSVAINFLRRIQIPGGCSPATLTGPWAIQASGNNIATTALVAQNSRLNFDGKGGVSGNTQVVTAGVPSRSAVSGYVNVNTDCTFLMKYTDSSGEGTLIWGTLFGEGDQFFLIYSVDGVVIVGSGRKAAQ